MTSGRNRLRLCTALLLVNLAVIWGNSLIPGEISGKISGFAVQLLGRLLGLTPGESQGGHGLLRKLAHFSEFACFGALLSWRLGMAGKEGTDRICRTLLSSLVTACLDETIQIFVDDRSSSLLDVWIDASGAAVGMTVLMIGHHLIKKRKHNHILEETT